MNTKCIIFFSKQIQTTFPKLLQKATEKTEEKAERRLGRWRRRRSIGRNWQNFWERLRKNYNKQDRCHQWSTQPDPQSHQYRANIVFFRFVSLDLKSGDRRTYGRTTCAKTMIPTGRDCGLAEWINYWGYEINSSILLTKIHYLFMCLCNTYFRRIVTYTVYMGTEGYYGRSDRAHCPCMSWWVMLRLFKSNFYTHQAISVICSYMFFCPSFWTQIKLMSDHAAGPGGSFWFL